MAVSRAERRRDRESRVEAVFGREHAGLALDLLEVVEFAWHDCYGEISPTEEQVDDMLLLSEGDIDKLIGVARLAISDWRDLKVAADARRGRL